MVNEINTVIILFLYYFCLIFIISIFCHGSGWFREDSVGFRVVPARFRGVQGGSVWVPHFTYTSLL